MEYHGSALATTGGISSPTAPASDDSVDEELLSEICTAFGDGPPAGLISACDLFFTGVPARLDDIDAALAAGNFDRTAQVAHSLKGSAGAFGARGLSNLATRLEQECGNADGSAASRLLDEMRAEFGVFGAILGSRLAALSE